MAFQNKSFVLGEGKAPEWFNEITAKGRVKINHEDGDLLGATLFTPTGTEVAEVGDTIVLTKSGLSVKKRTEVLKSKKEEK